MSTVYLLVTHIEKQGPFLKIWGQTDKSASLIIKKTLMQLAPQFDQGNFMLTYNSIQIANALYCAKYIDNAYYRVRITNLMQNNLVEVHFIDYGYKEVLSIMNLRLVPTFAPALVTVIPQAKDFILGNVTYQGVEWDEATFALVNSELCFKEVSYSVITNLNSHLVIKVYRNGSEDYALSLFNRGIVLSIALNAQLMIMQNTRSNVSNALQPVSIIERPTSMLERPTSMLERQPSIINRQTPSPISIPHIAPQLATIQTPVPPPTLVTYKGAKIEPGIEYQVYVSYVCDGPCQFSIQLQKAEDNLVRLMKELNAMTLQPLEEFPMPGTVCVARCIEDDHICRAVVTNMVDSQYKVFYVDFGNTEVIPIENLFQIPFKYVIPKVMATRYALAGLDKSSVTLEMKCAFKEFVCDKLLRMQALPAPARSALPLCNLFDSNNVNVLDVLQRVALLSYPEATQLLRGFSQEVHVSYVHSCGRFYIQIKGKEQELTNLMNNVQQACGQSSALQTFKVGLPCCSLFEDDNQWYRAEITNIEGQSVRVRYVDYGNDAVVTTDYLVKPPGEIITALRPQAVECCLNGYQNMEDDLERDNILEQLILDKDFTMKVIEMHGNRALVDLIDSSKYNVGSLLLEQLAAAKSQVGPILVQENHQIEPRRKRSTDESTNFNRNERKPLRDQNERGFNRQDSWRQPKSSRNDDDFDKPKRDSDKPWRENMDNTRTDRFPRSRDNFDKTHNDDAMPHRDNFEKPYEKRDGFNKDDSQDDKNSSWKSKKDDDWSNNSNNQGGFKKKSWEQRDGDSGWKSKPKDESTNDEWGDNSNNQGGFKKKNWEQRDGDSGWKSKPKEDGGWDNDRGQRQNRFGDNRRPREGKSSFGNKNDTWGSSDTATSSIQNKVVDPAPFTTPFAVPDVINHNEKVIISWFHNPVHFFCQLYDTQVEFKTMMEDIQNHYCNIKPESAPVGSSVVALFPDDSVMYRARVLEVTGFQYRVQYVDFGNVSNTEKVWPIENRFMKLAAQAICCGLNGIAPVSESWSNMSSFSAYFNHEYYDCQFVSSNEDRYCVELTHDGITSVSGSLVVDGLAQPSAKEIYDPSILLGQQIKVALRDYQALNSFNLELPNGELIPCTIHNLAEATETFEDTLKQFVDKFVLMYVDNVLEEKIEVTLYETTGIKIKAIEPDEGAFEVIEIPSPLPILYSAVNGWVSFMETEGVSVIYIQPSEYADTVAELLERLFNCYEGVDSHVVEEFEVDNMYAAHSSDGNWYRGIIKSIEVDSVVVKYIDYGNSETVEKKELKLLTDEFLDQHILTLQVTVAEAQEYTDQNVTGTVWYGENGWEAELQILPGDEQAPCVEPSNVAETQDYAIEEPTPNQEAQVSSEVDHVQVGASVILSHSDSPSEFYLQQSEALETIENLQATLQVQVLEFPNLENPAVGILCAAPYSLDLQWYRAQILDADEDITTVRFVDYGNTDVITNDSSNVKTLPPELLSLEQYARRSSLMIEPNGSEWSSAAFDRFVELTSVDCLTVEIVHQDEKTTFVRLFANGVDVAETLLQGGLANKLQLETESSCTGYISNLNSPSEFWIQLENSVGDLEWVAEQLSSANNFPELEDLTPGSLCAALFPDDEMWYRARILSNTVAGIEVLFIDYGNSCTCISLRQLPEDLIMLAPLAPKCSLQKPPEILQWGHHANNEFKTISADGAAIFTIDKVSTGETYIVRLLLNGEDIVDKLLPITEDAYISHFESISSFWMQKSSTSSKLDEISATLTNSSEWPKCEGNPEGDELVAALFSEDEVWYRARIISKEDCIYTVFFIDYGNTGIANDIRTLNCDIDKEPPLAISCKLEPLPGFQWNDSASETLAEINNEGATQFQVEFLEDDVVRLYLHGSDVRLKLDSNPVSSVQSSPKKSYTRKSYSEPTNEVASESREAVESILNEIEISFNNEITSKESDSESIYQSDQSTHSVQVAEEILMQIENNVNKELLFESSEGDSIENMDTSVNTDAAITLVNTETAITSAITDSAITSAITDSAITSVNIETAITLAITDSAITSVNTDAAITSMNADAEITSVNTDAAIISVNTDAAITSVNTDAAITTVQGTKANSISQECNNIEELENDHSEEQETANGVQNHIDDLIVEPEPVDSLETYTFQRRLSIPHSERIVPGFYNSEIASLGCNKLFLQLEDEHYHSLTQNEAETNKIGEGTNTQIALCSGTDFQYPERRLSTLHEDKIVSGYLSYSSLSNEIYESEEDCAQTELVNENNDNLEHEYSGNIAQRSLPTPLDEKIVPGSVSHSNSSLNDFDNEIEGNVITRWSVTPNTEKIVPGSICRGDLDSIIYYTSHSTGLEFTNGNENEVQETVIEYEGTDKLGHITPRRPSTPCVERIVPGSVCRGDLDNDHIEIVPAENIIVTQVLNSEVEPQSLASSCTKVIANGKDVDVTKSRCSLSYTEKIVPGSISRGDLSELEKQPISDESVQNNKDSNQLTLTISEHKTAS